jgi:hypothetical protein
MRSFHFLLATATCLCTAISAFAWDYEGHRAVNQLALESLPTDFPAFVKTPEARERIAFLAGEPDRWRNVSDLALRHTNGPDHYIDIEELEDAGLNPAELSEFRHIYTVQYAVARAAHPDRFAPIDPEKNKDHVRELAGYVPWSITECYARLKSGFAYLKAYEERGGTPEEIANAQANILYIMGVMGHYVGDAAQPLHTTKHFNGWAGDNPKGYTTVRTFHSLIDGGFFQKTGGISAAKLVTRLKPAAYLPPPAHANGRSPLFVNVLNYVLAQQKQVEPLYTLEKAGKLSPEKPESAEGRTFLEDQILAAGNMLGSLWVTAWKEAPPDTYLISSLEQRKASAAQPAKP